MNVIEALSGGDLRSIGASNAVVRYVLRRPEALAELARGLSHDDPVVRARAADALEKVSGRQPEWLASHKAALLAAMRCNQKEVRWHMAQMAPRLHLSARQRARVVAWLFQCLDDESLIVRASALTALTDMATDDVSLFNKVAAALERATRSPIASTRARAKKLLRRIAKLDGPPITNRMTEAPRQDARRREFQREHRHHIRSRRR